MKASEREGGGGGGGSVCWVSKIHAFSRHGYTHTHTKQNNSALPAPLSTRTYDTRGLNHAHDNSDTNYNPHEQQVEYASDLSITEFFSHFPLPTMDPMEGSPIDGNEACRFDDPEYYRTSGWNLHNLPFCMGSALRYFRTHISGLTAPWYVHLRLYIAGRVSLSLSLFSTPILTVLSSPLSRHFFSLSLCNIRPNPVCFVVQ